MRAVNQVTGHSESSSSGGIQSLRLRRAVEPGLLLILAISVAGTAAALSLDVVGSLGSVKGDEATYVMMALSAAHDGDMVYESTDLSRFYRLYEGGPEGLFLKRQAGPEAPGRLFLREGLASCRRCGAVRAAARAQRIAGAERVAVGRRGGGRLPLHRRALAGRRGVCVLSGVPLRVDYADLRRLAVTGDAQLRAGRVRVLLLAVQGGGAVGAYPRIAVAGRFAVGPDRSDAAGAGDFLQAAQLGPVRAAGRARLVAGTVRPRSAGGGSLRAGGRRGVRRQHAHDR